MKVQSVALISTVSLTMGAALMGAIAPAHAGTNDAKFICGTSKGMPATVALTSRGYVPVVRWSSDYFGRSGFSAQTRCKMVSAKFQQYYKNGTLNYLTTAYQNRQPVICVASAKGGPCAGVLFTLKPTSNPMATLRQLMQVRTQAGGPVVLNESTGGSLPPTPADERYLDMQDFLQTAAVEPTSSKLPKRGLW